MTKVVGCVGLSMCAYSGVSGPNVSHDNSQGQHTKG